MSSRIYKQLLFHSLRTHQRSADHMKISKDQSAQTRILSFTNRFWLSFSIIRVLYLKKLSNTICDPSADSNSFVLPPYFFHSYGTDICSLAFLRPTLDHCQEYSVTNQIFITVIDCFQPGHFVVILNPYGRLNV